MNKIDSVSRYVCRLSVEQIEKLSDKEIKGLRMVRPFHPDQFGFMLDKKYFNSDERFSITLCALMKRLGKLSDC